MRAFLSIILYLFGAILMLTVPKRVKEVLAIIIPLSATALIFSLFPTLKQGEVINYHLPIWLGSFEIHLYVDWLSFLMAGLTSLIGLAVSVYSTKYIKEHSGLYYSMLMLLLGSIISAFLAGDLLNFYIFSETALVATYLLVIHHRTEYAFKAGLKYLIMSLFGAGLILLAIILTHQATHSFGFSALRDLTPGRLSFVSALFLAGCLIKIGAVPVHTWLPDAHPAAPSPVSALLSGITIKIGAYGILRFIFPLVLPFSMPSAIGSFLKEIVIIGAGSMLVGVILALLQTDAKKLLAYHSVSQMGYVLLGVGIGSSIGLTGGLFHLVNHALFKALLFLGIGAVIYATGIRNLNRLGGLYKKMPATMVLSCIGALAISGIPPFNGYVSKVLLSQAVAQNLMLKLVLILTSILTFASFTKLIYHIFFGSLPKSLENIREAPKLLLLPMAILALGCSVVGIYPNTILGGLITPALGGIGVRFDFWKVSSLLWTLPVVLLGSLVYALGQRAGIFDPERWGKRFGQVVTWGRRLSLDRIYLGAARGMEMSCRGLRRIHDQELSVQLLWVIAFLALVLILK